MKDRPIISAIIYRATQEGTDEFNNKYMDEYITNLINQKTLNMGSHLSDEELNYIAKKFKDMYSGSEPKEMSKDIQHQQYRIIQSVTCKYYVQVEQQTTTSSGYLWWKKTKTISIWKSLTRIGTIPYGGAAFKHKNNKAKGYDTMKDAMEFISRMNTGTIVYGCY